MDGLAGIMSTSTKMVDKGLDQFVEVVSSILANINNAKRVVGTSLRMRLREFLELEVAQ